MAASRPGLSWWVAVVRALGLYRHSPQAVPSTQLTHQPEVGGSGEPRQTAKVHLAP